MSNPFSAVGRFFKRLFNFVIKSDPFKALVQGLLPEAIAIVAQLGVSALSSADKRATAFDQLAKLAKRKGLVFADHMLNLIIELAVAEAKGTLSFE